MVYFFSKGAQAREIAVSPNFVAAVAAKGFPPAFPDYLTQAVSPSDRTPL